MRGARIRLWGVALVALGALVPPLASPVPAGAHGCPSWARVKAFHGSGSMSFAGSATAPEPGSGLTKTVALARDASGLHIRLGGRVDPVKPTIQAGGKTIKLPTEFLGGASGGKVSVGDTYAYSDSGVTGTLSAGAPLQIPGAGAAFLVLYPHGCSYQLTASFDVATIYSGVPWGDKGGFGASGGAITPKRPIPKSLKLTGSAPLSAYYTGCSDVTDISPDEQGCYEFGGGWATDFNTLKTCHSVVAENCGPDDEEEGTAHVSWSLTPKYKKHKKHPHKHHSHQRPQPA